MSVTTSARVCRGKRHTATNTAWNEGCRCRPALAAHDQWILQQRERRRRVSAELVRNGVCVATVHNTVYAYDQAHCRCGPAVDAYRAKTHSAAPVFAQWRKWRGPQSRVSRINLWLLVDGVAAESTRAERRLAAEILARRKRPGIAGPQPMGPAEIGERLGISDGSVYRLRNEMKELAERRAERRLADVRWKAARAARAEGRRAAETDRHAAAAEARAARRMHYRTIRRLRASQVRAKRVALAIEQRVGLR